MSWQKITKDSYKIAKKQEQFSKIETMHFERAHNEFTKTDPVL